MWYARNYPAVFLVGCKGLSESFATHNASYPIFIGNCAEGKMVSVVGQTNYWVMMARKDVIQQPQIKLRIVRDNGNTRVLFENLLNKLTQL